jgi:glutathione S-transferase
MQDLIVHSIPGSPFGRAVLVALEEKNVRYCFRSVSPGSLKSAEHLSRHPFGRIPALEHGTFRLYETQAILRYLDRILPQPALTPADSRSAAQMDQLMNINDWYLFQGVASVIGFQRIVGPRLMGLKTDEDAITASMPKAHAVFGELARQLGEKPYFLGESVSLADVMLAPQLDFLRDTPEWETLTSGHENLRSWLNRMNTRPSMIATTWERVAGMANAA